MRFEYAPAPESRSVVTLRDSYGLFIGGEFVAGSSVFKTISPATEEVLAEVTHAGPEDVDRAVAAARQAYERIWSVMPGRERGKYLFRIARLLQERSRELAVLETMDNGKPIRESRDVDIPLAAAHFFYHAGWADKLGYAGFGSSPRPLGVVGQVIPWNFPLLMLAWKIAPALACGNTVVLKPAETTPLTALLFAEICQQADLPPGVVNIVTGDGATGQAVVAHPGIDKVAFTGSTSVGKEIARSCAVSGKRLTLELGGKAANVVFDDAPVDQAVEGIVNGIFFNQGHVCCAGSRLLVQESIADELLDALKRRMASLRLGDPMDKNTDIGAINSRAQLDKIRRTYGVRGDGRGGAVVGAVRPAGPRVLVPADGVHRRVAGAPHRPGGDLRPGAFRAYVPHASRGGREGEQYPVRPVGRGMDGEGVADLVDGVPAAGRGGLGEHVQPVRSVVAVRRVQGVRFRPGRRQARPGGLPGRPRRRRCLRPRRYR